ncbi:MAG: DNA-directed RNA polymerase subunit delta [Bacilli bacterium]|nr:DNA-directed RNA polymerase subunit delta [Bacilli bacterium]MDD4733638.1 DNA-directed RNA polymerase subunit delta [Bacilli bacterium]
MKIAHMKKADLELMSYTDLTEIILKEEKKSMTTPEIFKKICEVLEYSNSDYENNIGEYYTSLTTDKRFALLEGAKWDLREKYAIPLEVEEDDEEIIEDFDDEEEEEEENIDEEEDIDSLVDEDDELGDLTILEEEELDEN